MHWVTLLFQKQLQSIPLSLILRHHASRKFKPSVERATVRWHKRVYVSALICSPETVPLLAFTGLSAATSCPEIGQGHQKPDGPVSRTG